MKCAKSKIIIRQDFFPSAEFRLKKSLPNDGKLKMDLFLETCGGGGGLELK